MSTKPIGSALGYHGVSLMTIYLCSVRLFVLALVGLVLAFGLGGCASMSKDECQLADWRSVGYQDGVRGYGLSRIADHRSACREYRVEPDVAAYRSGYSEGITVFCQPENGFRHGRDGQSFRPICPASLAQDYTQAFRQGEAIFDAQQALDRKRKDLDGLQDRLDEVRANKAKRDLELAAEIVADSTKEQRQVLLARSVELSLEGERLEAKLRRLQADVFEAEHVLQRLLDRSRF